MPAASSGHDDQFQFLMNLRKQIPVITTLDQVAEQCGLAIAVAGRRGEEISASNNNSICRLLNPGGKYCRECAAFCGTALEESLEVGGPVTFTCHAGLDCRADAFMLDGKPAAVIVGRSFSTAENYRKTTERASSGDWTGFPADELFENIPLTDAADSLEKALEMVANAAVDIAPERAEPVAEAPSDVRNEIAADAPPNDTTTTSDETPAPPPAQPRANVAAWRSFFSGLQSRDYVSACESIIGFLGREYGLDSLAWLDRRGDRLVSIAAGGELRGRKLKLGIRADDPRLAEAVSNEEPIELGERSRSAADGRRTMCLFPVPVGIEIPSALAVLGDIGDDDLRRRLSRLCRSIGPQIEVLRLRNEVSRREALASAVRRFGEGLKHADSDDFWLHLTQVATELMQAERGSLLVAHPVTGELEIKAAIGARSEIAADERPGGRVARIILKRGEPTVVADVTRSGLPPASPDRGYKTASFMSAPVTIGGRSIAVINFTDKATGEPFSRDDLDLLHEISPQIAVAIDRAVLKERAGEFEQLSVTDQLTGLLNRRYIEERLMEEVKRSNRHGYPMSFIMLDVDHFKSYNDQFGHPAGDEALRIVAGVIRDTLRSADVAARFGGEEFAILLPQTHQNEAAMIAERIRANVAATTFPCREVTISVGVATCTDELCTTEGIVLAADKALYAAKHAGRNTVQIYDELGEMVA